MHTDDHLAGMQELIVHVWDSGACNSPPYIPLEENSASKLNTKHEHGRRDPDLEKAA